MSRSKRETLEVVAPTRIDLAGGTVDIWPIYLFHDNPITINVAIDLFVRMKVWSSSDGSFHIINENENKVCKATSIEDIKKGKDFELFRCALKYFRPDHGIGIAYRSMAPKGAGLAGSSAVLAAISVALCHINHIQYTKKGLIDIIRDIETQLIQVPAGTQDYFPVLWGGVNKIVWDTGSNKRESLACSIQDLQQCLMLVYTGTSRYSGSNNWEILKRHIEGNRRIRRLMDRIIEATHRLKDALMDGNYLEAGRAIHREYKYRRQLLPGIVTKQMKQLEDQIMALRGVLAIKVCGAGGGGCMLIFVDPDRRMDISQRIVRM